MDLDFPPLGLQNTRRPLAARHLSLPPYRSRRATEHRPTPPDRRRLPPATAITAAAPPPPRAAYRPRTQTDNTKKQDIRELIHYLFNSLIN